MTINSSINRIDKVSITDQVVGELTNFIKNGNYEIGDKLPPEETLRKSLGVGRSTVREALRILQAMRIIEIRPGKGAFVLNSSSPTLKMVHDWFTENQTEIEHLMRVRLVIESLAVSLAISSGTEEQIGRIQHIHERFKQVYEEDRLNNFKLAVLDNDFHAAILAASNNPYVVRIGSLISEALVEYRKRSFAVVKNIVNALYPHEQILRFLLERNQKAAVAAIEEHIAVSLEDMLDVIGEKL